jgi:hypothetical protein
MDFYRKVDPRRKQELSDARMIQEDQNAMANLSNTVINRQYNPDRFKHDCMAAPVPYTEGASEVGE